MTKLYKFQKEGVKLLRKFDGRVLLADEMGLGKTIQTLKYLKKNPSALPAVVVCPASLKWVWEYEARRHCGFICAILEGTKPPKKNLVDSHSITIINYEILTHWLPHLEQLNFQTVIIDECHYQKSRTAKRTKAVHKLSKGKPHVIALSGTPLTNRPAELYTTLHLLWPKEYPSFWAFAFRYCKPSRRSWGWEFNGACNLDELHTNLKKLGMVRRLKKDVLNDLPNKTRDVVPLDIEKPAEYRKANKDFINWLKEKSVSKALKAAKAEKMVQMGYLKRLAAQLKMKQAIAWVDNFLESSDNKLVIFATHKSVIKKIHERYKDISVVVDGSVSGKKRKWAVNLFQENKKIRLFIGNLKAAGTGLTLTAASDLAFLELDWVPGNHTQAEDRIHRIGQTEHSNIYYLIAKGTIEEKLCGVIQEKQKVISNVLDEKAKFNQLDVFDLLSKELLK